VQAGHRYEIVIEKEMLSIEVNEPTVIDRKGKNEAVIQ